MLHSLLAQATTTLAAVAVAWAIWRGRWPERWAAAAIGVDWAGSVALQHVHGWVSGRQATLLLDVGQFAVLLLVVVASRRVWILWAAAFNLLILVTALTMAIEPRFGPWDFLTANYFWSVGLIAALGLGAALEGQAPAGRPPTLGEALRRVA